MEPEIRLRHGSYVILYAEKVAILPKNPCTFYIARQGRKQTVSPIDIQLRNIKKNHGCKFLKKVWCKIFF